jgi:hypothetical protein
MRRRTFVGALMAAAAVGFGLRLPNGVATVATITAIDPSAGSITTDTPSLWSTKVHHDGAVLTEEILERAYQAIVNEPTRPMEIVISRRTARRLYWMGYWR